MQMPSKEQMELYTSLFKGREDTYAKRWEKNGKSGYSPAYEFNWNEFMVFKAKGGNMKDFPNKKQLPLNEYAIQQHLNGKWFLGIYPLLDENTSHFIVADFDKENWKEDSSAFLKICERNAIPAYLERSRSGNGAHVWVFFEKAYPAFKSRKIFFELIRKALGLSEFEKEISFDRFFPNQDYHSKKGYGNLIALPMNGQSLGSGNTAFLDPKSFTPFEDQWNFLKSIKRLGIDHLNGLYAEFSESNEDQENLFSEKGVYKEHLQIIIKNQIFLKRSQLNGKLVRYLRGELNFFNSEYLIKQRVGKSTYKTEKYFNVIGEFEEEIMIPRGFVRQLVEFCEEHKLPYKILDERTKLKPTKFKSKIQLYSYQKDVLDIVEEKDFGVIVAPPGAGKTIMGLEIITQKEQPALIIVHRKQLLDQWVDRIQSFLGIPKKDIGQIYSSKKKVGRKITIAMMQSLVKMDNPAELKQAFGTIIVDECHHIPAKTFREVITRFNSYYLYGLTATPKRKHNDEKLIFVYIGNILAQIDHNFNKNGQAKPLPNVVIRETKLSVPFDSKTDSSQILSKILTYDSARNQMIVDDVAEEIGKGKRALILTERKEHVDALNLYFNKQFEIITITGDDKGLKRKSKMQQIQLGHFQILISTGQFFGEGLDIEHLDCLFLVYPFSFEGKLIQYIGRIQRGDESTVIFDYRDSQVDYYEKLFKSRRRYYRKMGKTKARS